MTIAELIAGWKTNLSRVPSALYKDKFSYKTFDEKQFS